MLVKRKKAIPPGKGKKPKFANSGVANAARAKSTKKQKAQTKEKCSFDPDTFMGLLKAGLLSDARRSSEYNALMDSHASLFIQTAAGEFNSRFETKNVDSKLLAQNAIDAFLGINERMREYSSALDLPSDSYANGGYRNKSLRHQRLIVARMICRRVLDIGPDMDRWFLACKHGPGSTIGVSKPDTSIYAKFHFPVTATWRQAKLFDRYLSWNRPLAKNIRENYPVGDLYEIVEASRASTVPKSDSKRRFIAVEPTIGMFFQQGLMTLMYEALNEFGINLTVAPEKHKKRARLGSVDGSYATIDFSSASDCVLPELVEYLLPPNWVAALRLVRTPAVDIPKEIGKDGRPIVKSGFTRTKLYTYATMGNATTFPVETLVFWSLALASCWVDTNPGIKPWPSDVFAMFRKHVLQFGDDCILPSSHAVSYMRLSASVGLIVNEEKSHWRQDDGFRESCGGDYLRGRAIAVVKPRRPQRLRCSNLEPWLYTMLNRFETTAIEAVGPDWAHLFTDTLDAWIESFHKTGARFKLVPPFFSEEAGYRGCSPLLFYKLRKAGVSFSRITRDQHGTVYFLYKHGSPLGKPNLNGRIALWDNLRQLELREVHEDLDADIEKGQLLLALTRLYGLDMGLLRDGLSSTMVGVNPIIAARQRDASELAYSDAKSHTGHWSVPYVPKQHI